MGIMLPKIDNITQDHVQIGNSQPKPFASSLPNKVRVNEPTEKGDTNSHYFPCFYIGL
jgi:hypothetical protein